MSTITIDASVEAGYVQESRSWIEVTSVGRDSSGEKIEGAETADC
jgi:hypothetical protein